MADADQREMHVSVGCALENFLVAAEHFGFAPRVAYFPEPANEYLAAKVTLARGDAGPRRDPRLFDAIPVRHTNHETYEERPVPEDALERVRACVAEPDVALFMTADAAVRRTVDDLVIESDALQFSDRAYREELAYWIKQGVFGTPWLMAQLARLAVAYVNLGSTYAKKDSDVLMSAPVLALVATAKNDRTSQVRAGQAFERVYLTAAALGLAVRPMSQVLEVPGHKERIAGLLGPEHPFPQQTFLLGFAPPATRRTPRRSVEEVAV